MAYCSFPGCENSNHARGLCVGHYQQWQRGVILSPLEPRCKLSTKDDLRDFLKQRTIRVPKPTGEAYYDLHPWCREWQGAVGKRGYPLITYQGEQELANRLVCRLWHGESILEACHRCDNKRCVGPKHLYWGSHADNMQDALIRGQLPIGSDTVMAKLTESAIPIIREMSANGHSYRDLAEMHGVSVGTIGCIVNRQTWKHVA